MLAASLPARPGGPGRSPAAHRRRGPVAKRPAVGIAVLCAALVALAGCGGGASGAGSPTSDKGYVSGNGRSTTFTVADRTRVPDISGRTLDGRRLDLAGLRGKVVVLNVWASWCPPCRKEAASLERVWRQTRSSGVQFVGVDSRDTAASARAFQRTFGVSYPSVVDTDGELQLRFRGKLAAAALPTTYVIDRDGRVAARATDLLTDVKLRTLLEPVLAEKS